MANVISNLPMPALNGAGAAVDVSTMGRDKTIVITGTFSGATITVEVSEEAGGAGAYAPIHTFQSGDRQKTIPVAARFMRVNVANRKVTVPFTATADVGADDMGATFAVVALPTLNGAGANVNVSALGEFKTIVVGGSFPGAAIRLEVSDDGTDFAPVTTFASYGGSWTGPLVGTFLRCNVSGRNATLPFTSVSIAVGAIVDPTVPPAPTPIPGASTCFIFEPGGGQTGPGTFDTWADLMTALTASRAQANGSGCYTIQFNDETVTPAVIPAGTYDMENVTWEGEDANLGAAVSIANGAHFTKLRRFAGSLQIVNHNTVTAACADLVAGDLITLNQTTLDTQAGGAAFYDGTGVVAGAPVVILLYESSQLGASATGPVVNFPTAGSALFVTMESPSTVVPGVLVGAVGATLSLASSTLQSLPTVFASWLGTISTPRLDVSPSFVPIPYLAVPAVVSGASMAFGQWRRLNASGGALTQQLPAISAATGTLRGPGCIAIVSETGGGVLSATPAAGDTIQGSGSNYNIPPSGTVMFISNGISDWRVVAQQGNDRSYPPEQWEQENVAASQAAVALSAQVSTNFDTWKAVRAGSIVGLATRLNTPCTAGTLTVTASINGVATTISVATTSVSNASGGITTQSAGVDRFVAGDLIGTLVTTSAGWLPITAELEAYLEIEEVR